MIILLIVINFSLAYILYIDDILLYIDVGRSWHLKGLKEQQTNKSKQNKNKEYKTRGELKAIDSHASNQLQQHLNCWPVLVG